MADAKPSFDALGWHRAVLSERCTLDTQESIVLLALVKYADERGVAYPGLGTLERDTRVSRRKVILALDELERRGLVVRARQTRGQGFGATLYRLPVTLGSASHALGAERTGSASHALEVVHTVHSGSASHAPYLPNDLPNGTIGQKPAQPKPRPKAPKKGSRGETYLSPDWQPTEAHLGFAAKHGLDVELELVGFRGHYEGKKAASWNGRFSTWLANGAKWKRERNGGRQASANQRDKSYDDSQARLRGNELGGASS